MHRVVFVLLLLLSLGCPPADRPGFSAADDYDPASDPSWVTVPGLTEPELEAYRVGLGAGLGLDGIISNREQALVASTSPQAQEAIIRGSQTLGEGRTNSPDPLQARLREFKQQELPW